MALLTFGSWGQVACKDSSVIGGDGRVSATSTGATAVDCLRMCPIGHVGVAVGSSLFDCSCRGVLHRS